MGSQRTNVLEARNVIPPGTSIEDARISSEIRCSYMKSYRPQFAAVIVVYLLRLSFHVSSQSHNGRIEDDVDDWSDYSEFMDVMFCVLGIIVFLLSGFMFHMLSRKTCVYTICVCFIVTGIIFESSKSVVWDTLAEACRRFGTVLTWIMTIIYVSEIAHDDIRGTLILTGPVVQKLYNTVIMISALVLKYLFTFSWFVILPPAVAIVCFIFWLPDTPIYFLRQGNKTAAEHSMMWLRGSGSPEHVAAELEKKNQMLITTRSDSSSTTSVFRELLSRRSLKYTGIVLVLNFTYNFSAAVAISNTLMDPPFQYSYWFKIKGPLQLIAGIIGIVIAIIICDRKGRRFSLLTSTIMCSMGLIPLAIYAHITEYKFVRTEGIFLIIFALVNIIGNQIGYYIAITVVPTDIFPPKTLNIQLTLNGIFIGILHYIYTNFINPKMSDTREIALFFWFNAVILVATGIFIFKFLPETKHRPTGFLFMESREDVLLSNIQNRDSE